MVGAVLDVVPFTDTLGTAAVFPPQGWEKERKLSPHFNFHPKKESSSSLQT